MPGVMKAVVFSLVSGDTQVLKDEGSVQEEQVVGICDTAANKYQQRFISRLACQETLMIKFGGNSNLG